LRDFERTPEWEGIDAGLREQMAYGKDHVAAPDVLGAMDLAHRLNVALVELFHDVDYLLTPTCAGQTPAPGEFGTINGHPEVNWVRFTYGFNMTRSPAGSVCAGLTAKGLPVGLQVVGPQHADAGVLRLMALLEDTIAFDQQAPIA
jgi:Asp-tRNA(Asn)/Glu-tRNA(Gln) amidotransferase A subunit family amidase